MNSRGSPSPVCDYLRTETARVRRNRSAVVRPYEFGRDTGSSGAADWARRLLQWTVVGVHRTEELTAFQVAQEFKLEVYRLLERCPAAMNDYRFRGQLCDAASGIERCAAEGFGRRRPGEFSTFFRYALASLDESMITFQDGVHRRYFTTVPSSS